MTLIEAQRRKTISDGALSQEEIDALLRGVDDEENDPSVTLSRSFSKNKRIIPNYNFNSIKNFKSKEEFIKLFEGFEKHMRDVLIQTIQEYENKVEILEDKYERLKKAYFDTELFD